MTVQLELDFLPIYVNEAIAELLTFAAAVSGSSFKQNYLFRYREMERQATDLKNYAFFHGYINSNEHECLSNLIIESLNLFWSA